ncbi:OmpA family protein [Streptomyces decoyicus]|uniref:OmpA family protein n=1 Tax=Streptomyces decoyicus TaxID=249567 RepID=A0ABZ1FTP6_9ACTN|nr:OmpA family protein [Streptomyces decoyicus]WSB73307.1 OmpA family protein [Streptomyces decoyicus]
MTPPDTAALRASGRRTTAPTLAGALVTVLTAGLLSACGEAPRLDACAWMKEPVDTAGRTVVLVDDSASVRGRTAGRDYAHSIGRLLADVVDRKDMVSVGSFSGDSAQITWIAKDRSTDWIKDNDNAINQKKRKQQAADCLTDLVGKAESAAPRSGGSNVLAALTAGVSSLDAASGSRSLLVLTDGLSTTGCADLRAAAFRDTSEINAIARVCAARDETPSLTGVDLTLAGLGQPATDQPAPTAAQRTWLTALWRKLCGAADPTAPGTSCTLAPTAIGTAGQRAPDRKPPQDPVIRYADDRPETYQLPGAALFDTNSSTVRPQALPLLNDVAVRARTTPGSRVAVLGYVDPRGRPDNNQQLSQARANAVKKVLTGLGVTRVTAHGRGLPTGCSKPADAAGGRMTAEEKLQCDRRVDIEIIRK